MPSAPAVCDDGCFFCAWPRETSRKSAARSSRVGVPSLPTGRARAALQRPPRGSAGVRRSRRRSSYAAARSTSRCRSLQRWETLRGARRLEDHRRPNAASSAPAVLLSELAWNGLRRPGCLLLQRLLALLLLALLALLLLLLLLLRRRRRARGRRASCSSRSRPPPPPHQPLLRRNRRNCEGRRVVDRQRRRRLRLFLCACWTIAPSSAATYESLDELCADVEIVVVASGTEDG